MDSFLKSGKIWPYAIGLSITFIFGAAIATIMVSANSPVEKSDTYMMDYHEADAKANELIMKKIAFDKKYKISFVSNGISKDNTILQYRLTTVDNKVVDNGKLKAVLTRPNSRKFDISLENPQVSHGVYSFDSVKLPLAGRWDILLKVEIDGLERYLNIHADTRKKEVKEF